jgi:uncharacterized repeat protein (TIGR01451 family)
MTRSFRQRRSGLEVLEERCVPAGTITGLAFQDFNANGAFDTNATIADAGGTGRIGVAADRGVAGVTVTAYDAANAVRGVAASRADGSYTLSAAGTGPYRVQFTGLPAGFFSGPHGPNSGTTVQFVPDGNSGNISLGLVSPQQYAPDDPALATTCYVFGDQLNGPDASAPVIINFPYSAGADYAGGAFDDPNVAKYQAPSAHTLAVPARLVGTTWGLAYDQANSTLYAAAYMKKHAGFGPGGTGAIYRMAPTGSGASPYADLNALFGPGTAGANPHNTANYFDDNFNASWDAVGKVALGGVAASDDGSRLFVMNLADRRLYSLPTGGPLSAATVQRFDVPVPPGTTGVTAGNPKGDMRPFAVSCYQGLVYVGLVNSAESTQNRADLRAYVYTFDPAAGRFGTAPVLQFGLNFPRGFSFGGSDDWNAWVPGFRQALPDDQPGAPAKYPQPMLSQIAFDPAGNMVLGFRDRGGDQLGPWVPSNPNRRDIRNYLGVSAGDLYRAAINVPGNLASGWALENNASAGGVTTAGANNGKGPGGGEFYYQTEFFGSMGHNHVPMGGVTQVPGFPDVVTTAINPIGSQFIADSGGMRWLNNRTGAADKAYLIYDIDTRSTFLKAEGLGSLVFIPGTPPQEIGNRVWIDTNGNGIQDANEPGVAGVTVRLYSPSGALLATAVTDAKGEYYFSDARGSNTPNAVYGIAGLTPDTAGYTVRLDNPADFAPGGPLYRYVPTVAFAGADRSIDSKGVVVAGFDRAAVATGVPGDSDHTFDFGFVPPVDVSVAKTVSNPTPALNDVVTFAVRLTNNGTVTATGVQVTDVLPPGLTFLGATPSQGSYDPGTGIWLVGALPGGVSANLTLSVRVVSPDPRTNTAILTGLDEINTNPNTRASATETPQQSASGGTPVTPPETTLPANLAVVKTVDNASPHVGDVITFSVVVGNNGPGAAPDAVVNDLLPAGLLFVSATPTQGTYDSTTGVWAVGALANQAFAILAINARVVSANPLTNVATAGPSRSSVTVTPVSGIANALVTTPAKGAPVFPTFLSKLLFLGAADLQSDSGFLNSVYGSLLGRAPDQGGMNFWSRMLLAGMSRTAVVSAIAQSPERRGLEVDQLYQALLHRAADPAGRAFWVNALLSGAGDLDVARLLLSSAEYQAAHGSDAAFVAGLYADVLGRGASAAEAAGWQQLLAAGASRDALARALLTSPEADRQVVDRSYANYLQRPADATGEQFFLSGLQAGLPPEALAVLFLASDEYYQRF